MTLMQIIKIMLNFSLKNVQLFSASIFVKKAIPNLHAQQQYINNILWYKIIFHVGFKCWMVSLIILLISTLNGFVIFLILILGSVRDAVPSNSSPKNECPQ